MKRISIFISCLFFVLCLALVGCNTNTSSNPNSSGGSQDATGATASGAEIDYTQGESHTFVAASGSVFGNPVVLSMNEMNRRLTEITDGRITMEEYHNSALGGDREVFEQVAAGSIDFGGAGSAVAYNYVESCGIFDLPYLFTDYDHAKAVLSGEVGQNILKEFEGTGIKPLTWMTCGWRNLTTNKQINSPADMQGVKIRVLENEVYIDMFTALGAAPTPMAFTELYTALQQGTVDAEDNPFLVINSAKLYEVQDYIYQTEHTFAACLLVVSQQTWDSLSPSDQELVQTVANEMFEYSFQATEEADAQALVEIAANSDIEIVQIDKAPWIEIMRSIYPAYYGKYGEDTINGIVNFEY